MKEKKYTQSEIIHIENTLDSIRSIIRLCSEERMPQGPCTYCLELYRSAMNQAIDAGVYE
jgi:hypothetical protein